ncbi:putative spermidine/putrescine transport system substrate-binding protein [Microlunatus sagamiharensis]|uniref:Putative spermidine/putrescine transport system substrate-binding protein n=1 Tax=Microlunatus sagamiharensis TaxID=546874 RepID=A0A1H2N734_9ACTN|nr:ABC transporter substrate-binding protein [Microlunatus sagamiharensis]SDV01309.1 putative spermidine/putrescine transport system substrate-binding protein [Microlunatus sagamiharensis]
MRTTRTSRRFTSRITAAVAAASAITLLGAGCAPPAKTADPAASTSGAATWTSAQSAGGMDALVDAAKKEGTLNVIALPPDWANYGQIISTFESKYGIKVDSAQPDAASQDEINAADQQKGTDRAPDVFDLGQAVALANTAKFAPYQVSTWDSIPTNFKDSSGLWVNDYGGYMSIGYDTAKVPAPSGVKDLLKPEYKGKVALNGDPTQAGAAFNGVVMTSLANGGSADDIQPGIDFFADLKKAGNFLPTDPTSATIESGQTPLVIDWDYLNAAESAKISTWKVTVPSDALVGGYYFQAVSKDAPHPAAARLWQEFLYSDEGQNLFLGGGARPVRADAMQKAGTIDAAAYGKLPPVSGEPTILTTDQSTKAADVLSKEWSKATS